MMVAVEAVRSVKNERESEMGFSNDEADFGCANLLDAIDFDDLLVDGDVLPHLEIIDHHHHHFFAQEFSQSHAKNIDTQNNCQPVVHSVSEFGLQSSDPIHQPESEPKPEPDVRNSESDTSKKSSAKKKVKVDWTPELHRRFVEAVEQLGIDKAVPSRILEIMGIHCLTRHNIASHLQKYRSHRKHVQAREAEAASWGRRKQMYGAEAAPANPWNNAPATLGFPPVTHFTPLHVWGHPSVDQSLVYTWHKHVAPPLPPPADPSFWHPHHQYVPPPGTIFFPPPQFPPTRFPPPPAAGVPAVQTLPQPPSDVHPSKESIDAAIGDVIRKPWLPLPLGLKPPSIDSVIVQLRRQGLSKIPPT